MNIERDIFKRGICNFNKLLDYGFIYNNGYYVYETIFMDDFKAIISIDKNGNVSGKIVDILAGEEYTNFRTEMSGGFVSKVRDEYKSILTNIKNFCFDEKDFIFDQTNRIAKYIKDKYHNNPEFLWDDSPGCGVFRNTKTKKWYAIIMDIDYSKLDNRSGLVEVMNVKLRESEIPKLIEHKGFYKAYHMNKKSWISISLDETLDDEIIFSLIDESYMLVS